MKALKKILIVIAAVLSLLVLVGLFLPKSYHVERSTTINAPAAQIYPLISAFRRWPEWIAWTTNKYPDMQLKYGDSDTGVGAGYSWTGKSSGSGAIKFTQLDPGKGIGYALDFENGQYLSAGRITIMPEGAGVRVTWTNEGDLGANPLGRWFGLFMDRMMGPDFAEGLARLKARTEAAP